MENKDGRLEDLTMKTLQKMMGRNNNDEIRSKLLLGIATSEKHMLKDVRNYYLRKNTIGYLETMHFSTAKVECDTTSLVWNNIYLDRGEDFLDFLMKGIVLLDKLIEELNSKNYSSHMRDIKDFYGFERDTLEIDEMYIIPESSYLWTNELIGVMNLNFTNVDRDIDGFIKLHSSSVLQAVVKRLENFRNTWITADKFCAIETFCKSLSNISFHQQVIQSSCHLTESHFDEGNTLPHYLSLLCKAFQLIHLGTPKISFNVLQAILNVTSPQVSRYIPVFSHNLKQNQGIRLKLDVPELCQVLSKQFSIQKFGNSPFHFDSWLEYWRVLCITGAETDNMLKYLRSKTEEVNQQGKGINNLYVFDHQRKKFQHIFMVWLNSCASIKKKKVFSASTIFVHNIVRHIAGHQSLWEMMSLSNLLNIITVHVVGILTMHGICAVRTGYSGDLYIPSASYRNIAITFIHMIEGKSLFDSCLDDMKERPNEGLQLLKIKLIDLLDIMLKAMTGLLHSEFNPLINSVSSKECLQNGEAESCVTFVLVLFSNLGLIGLSDEQLEAFRYQICECICCCNSPAISQAYKRFSTCGYLNGCFGAVRDILEVSKDVLQHVKVFFNESLWRIDSKAYPAELAKTHQRRLKPIWFVPTKSKAVEIKKPSELRASAETFYPSSSMAHVIPSANEPELHKSVDNIAEEEPDQEVTLFPQVSVQDETTPMEVEEHPMVDQDFCRICICSLQPEGSLHLPEESINEGDSSFNKSDVTIQIQRYSDHCLSESHKTNIILYERFDSEINSKDYKERQEYLLELSRQCHSMSQRDTELKIVEGVIRDILKESDTICRDVKNSGEWREGVTLLTNLGEKMESLIQKANLQLELSIEKKKKLHFQEEDDERMEYEEDMTDLDQEEVIANADLDAGEAFREHVRWTKVQRKRKKLKDI